MASHSLIARRSALGAACAAILAMVAGVAHAQKQDENSYDRSQHSMTLPPDGAVLQLSAELPEKVKVGDSYDYQVHVSNVSDNIVVYDVVIAQSQADGFEIESAHIGQKQSKGQKGNKQAGKKQNQKQNKEPSNKAANKDNAKQGNQSNKGTKGNQSNQAKQSNKNKNQSSTSTKSSGSSSGSSKGSQSSMASQEEQGSSQAGVWKIGALRPGQTKTVNVTATSDKEGKVHNCFAIASFRPALCVSTEFVKPDINLVKKAPEQSNLCEEFEITYVVENKGSGESGSFTITDDLGEGLTTEDGKKQVKFDIENLGPNDTEEFTVTVNASDTGEYSSRAVAKSKNKQLSRSNKVTTTINEADLRVSISGPSSEYLNRSTRYKIRVSNQGEAPAPGTQLMLSYPEALNLANASDPKSVESSQDSDSNQQSQSQGNVAQLTSSSKSGNQGNQKQNQQVQMTQEEWKLGTLRPGDTMEIEVMLNASEAGQHKLVAEAAFACDREEELESQIVAQAQEQLEVIALPALLLVVVDDPGLVKKGEEVTYTVLVKNQGDAPDHNISVSAELPDSLELMNVDGPTKNEGEGKSLKFGKVDKLDAGDRIAWKVTAKATGDGEILFSADLESKGLSQTVSSDEPTTLIKK